jgi:alpha-N-arabinofuranosidase
VSKAIHLSDVQQQGGIHAPSIRYHKGTFYIVVTNVYSPKDKSLAAEMVNFVLTAKDPRGPWSMPHVIENAPGIDPDLFFDDDGKVYFVGTHDKGKPNANGIGEIWVQELDLMNWSLKGERSSIWTGACGGCCVEGPHIYKKDGRYYLMVAEGGTSRNHSVMIANSNTLRGPYLSHPKNPILTSRHLSNNNWVHSTGHADLVELKDGRWYMVALGIRNDLEGTTNMGRETHLIPVTWETAVSGWKEGKDGIWRPIEYYWPVCAPLSGKVERYEELPFEKKPQNYSDIFHDDFNSNKLDTEWNFRRVPLPEMFSLSEREGHLRLRLSPKSFKLRDSYHALGFRQKESDFLYSVNMDFSPKKNQSEAGISLFQQDNNYLNYTVKKVDGTPHLVLYYKEKDQAPAVLKKRELLNYTGNIILFVESTKDNYYYRYSLDNGKTITPFETTEANLILCKGYIGTHLGLYASSNGLKTAEFSDFDWIKYQGFSRK